MSALPRGQPPRREPSLTVLWSGPGLVAIDKPAGLATIPGRGETDSVLERLARQLGLPHTGSDDPRVRLVHRLDKHTSGVLLMATSVEAQRLLSHQFQNNTVSKEYLALVAGRPEKETGTVDAPLAPHPTSRLHMAISRHGRPARTDWVVEERLGAYALLRCFPRTGKTHQIRVHLRHVGLPLAVDPLYNPPPPGEAEGIYLSRFKRGYRAAKGERERPLIDRLTLHAHRLTFALADGQRVSVEAPVPKDLRAAVAQLRRHAR